MSAASTAPPATPQQTQQVPVATQQAPRTTQSQTYIPVPVPVTSTQKPSIFSAIFGLGIYLFIALLLRFLWRLPERMQDKEWVQNLGGPYAVQNHLLHTLGYVCFVSGALSQQFFLGVGAAALLMIASNVRPQGNGDY